mgnify:CR=1 FL=1
MDNTGRDAGTPSSKAKLGNSHHQIIDADQIIDNNPYDLASPETLHRRAENIIYSFHHPCSLITGCRMRSRKSPGGIIARFTREMKERTRLNIHKLRYGPSTTNEGNIRTLENGQQVIDRKQQKSGNHVVIPVRPELEAELDRIEQWLPDTQILIRRGESYRDMGISESGAREIIDGKKAGRALHLTTEELAFYDALTKPEVVRDFYTNDQLLAITHELTDALRKNKTIDWNLKESARAGMRRLVKRLLKKGQEDALNTIMEQCEMWSENN